MKVAITRRALRDRFPGLASCKNAKIRSHPPRLLLRLIETYDEGRRGGGGRRFACFSNDKKAIERKDHRRGDERRRRERNCNRDATDREMEAARFAFRREDNRPRST